MMSEDTHPSPITSEKLKELSVKCPTCGKKARWKNNPSRPFCSDRCKMIDLGKWADGSYSIESENQPDVEETE